MTIEPFPWRLGDSEMARRIRAHDWAASPLGPVQDWPQHLRTAVSMVLAMPAVPPAYTVAFPPSATVTVMLPVE